MICPPLRPRRLWVGFVTWSCLHDRTLSRLWVIFGNPATVPRSKLFQSVSRFLLRSWFHYWTSSRLWVVFGNTKADSMIELVSGCEWFLATRKLILWPNFVQGVSDIWNYGSWFHDWTYLRKWVGFVTRSWFHDRASSRLWVILGNPTTSLTCFRLWVGFVTQKLIPWLNLSQDVSDFWQHESRFHDRTSSRVWVIFGNTEADSMIERISGSEWVLWHEVITMTELCLACELFSQHKSWFHDWTCLRLW
jgi:hypothetical protein